MAMADIMLITLHSLNPPNNLHAVTVFIYRSRNLGSDGISVLDKVTELKLQQS